MKGPEKVEEILNLLKKYNVGDVVKLGPGTNRYGMKLDGFVVKVATDNDGKIDNMKEFKMAKRLFPRVPRTYEVSKNGLLLVAEYIQPFDSYSEMLHYADQIREILQELSAVYLIGDVGITSKNYANWGIRPGTDEVVCLDFAYVYDVSSDIFICRHCKTNTMLVPNKDFTKLVCPNPACGKETLFEDIRAMIPNDYHRRQIGDLSEEGYEMVGSNVLTELTEERSNYLARKHPKADEEKVEDCDRQEKEETEMRTSNNISIQAKAVAIALTEDLGDALVVRGRVVEDITELPEELTAEVETIDEVEEEEPIDDFDVEYTEELLEEDTGMNFAESFIPNSCRALSVLSNRIAQDLRIDDMAEKIRCHLRNKKMYAQDIYDKVQNAIFRSLAIYLQFEECQVQNRQNDGYHREFRAIPEIINDPNYAGLDTLKFIERAFNIRYINEQTETEDFIYAYTQLFNDHPFGLDWLPLFEQRLMSKMQISSAGCHELSEDIRIRWTMSFPEPISTDEDEVEEEELPDEIFATISATELHATTAKVSETTTDEPEVTPDADEEDEDDDLGYEADAYVSIEITPDETYDIVRVNSSDAFGQISIPIYVEDMDSMAETDALGLNGVWDWLKHMVPDMMFRTMDPMKYLVINDQESPDEDQIHMVVIGGDEVNGFVVGVYMLRGIYAINDDGEKIPTFDRNVLRAVNAIVDINIGMSEISHRSRSLSMEELIHDESYIESMITYVDGVDSDDEDVEEPEEFAFAEEPSAIPDTLDSDISEAEAAAIAAMISDAPQEEVVPEPAAEEEVVRQVSHRRRDANGRFMKADAPDDGVITPVRRK